MINSFISGCGSYLPQKILLNNELEKIVNTSDEWITTRTGIKQRCIADTNEYTSDMAAEAAIKAIEDSHIIKNDIDLIIVATTTPDKTFPSTAVLVQKKLAIKNCAAFDIQAVCSGYIYALTIADNFIKCQRAKNVLVIGAEKMSTIIDWTDRNTCVLFGDGAGATILSATKENQNTIIDCQVNSDGKYEEILTTTGGTCTTGKSGFIVMQGKEVFKHAAEKMSSCIKNLLQNNKLEQSNLDFVIPHQANIRIMDATAKKLKLPSDKIISTVQNHGNTSAASIPLALDYAAKKNIFHKGNLIALTAIGGGLTWGASLLRWAK